MPLDRENHEHREIAIDVHDTGPGVPPELREHLFEPFYTTRHEGCGLGLAVSRELVNRMGGTLEYRDGGACATFAIHLPAGDLENENGPGS